MQRSKITEERARAYVARIPAAIEGNRGDCQTLAVANALLWDFALPPSEALSILQEYNERCSPSWSNAELISKLRSAARQSHSKPRGNLLKGELMSRGALESMPVLRRSTKLASDPLDALEFFLRGFRCGEVDLAEASPIRLPDDWTNDGLLLLQHLYKCGELINFVTAYRQKTKKDGSIKANPNGYGTTLERDYLINCWRRDGMPSSKAGGWLRMNPTDGNGIDDANISIFRFALLESDTLPLHLLLALLSKLPLPIAVILTSGGASFTPSPTMATLRPSD